MAYTPWYKTGTVAIANGSLAVTGSGTSWLANAQQGQGIWMPDGKIYEIAALSADTSITLGEPYLGTTVASGGAYSIAPMQGFPQSAAIALTNLLNAAGNLISLTPTNGQIIQYVGSAYTTVSPATYLGSLLNAIVETNVASSGTTDIGNAATTKVNITGVTTITSLGAVANALRFVRFAAVLTLTYNATTLILPGAANISTAAGDTAIFMSDASGNWRCYDYTRAASAAVLGIFTSASSQALVVGPNGTFNPTFNVDASTASCATGLNVKGAAAGGGLALSVSSSGTNENITIDAKGTGTITIGGTSTGSLILSRPLTYGGVTLSNSVTGTGALVLNGAPALAGTVSINVNVTGSSGITRALAISSGGSAGGDGGAIDFGSSTMAQTSFRISSPLTGSQTGALIFSPGSGTINVFTEAARFASDGSFLVGTTTNGGYLGFAKLEVKQTSGTAISAWGAGAVDAITARTDSTSGSFLVMRYNGSTVVGSITTNGSTTTYGTTSDARFKLIDSSQSDMRSLITKSFVGDYNWKDGEGAFGFGPLAQELYKNAPNSSIANWLVRKPVDEDKDKWSVDGFALAAVTLWGVKDLYGLVTGLQAEIASLKSSVSTLASAR